MLPVAFTKKKLEFILEWSSTAILLIGVWLTAINHYPLNVVFSTLGNFGWLTVAIIWRKMSLITVQLVIVSLYIIGYLTK
jgi:hypothetical protein